MSTFLKPLVALLISILLFAGLIYLADGDLLAFIEARFYNPSIINSYVKENAVDAQLVQNHLDNLQHKFNATLAEPVIRNSFLYNQSPNDIFERSKIYGILLESNAGLQSVQFVDSNGIRIHYSTSSRDILSQNRNSTAYRNYNENPMSPPFETVSVQDGENAKLTMDEQSDRIIFSFPFRDSMDVYRGTALFYVSIRTLAERLIEEGRLKVSDNISVINEPSGILLGSPEISKTVILKRVAEIWNEDIKERITLDAEDSGAVFSLITVKTDKNIFFGRLVNNYLFSISEPMKLILKVSIFLTFFLTFFFLLNLKPNSVTVVRNRIKRLRESFFKQLDDNKTVQEKAKLILELEQRRDEIYTQLKHNLKLKRRMEENINSIIDKSWDEMLVYLKISSGHDFAAVHPVKGAVKKAEKLKTIEKVEAVEEIEPLEEVEAVEEIESLEEVEAVEEIESLEEVEAVEEIEPLEEVEAVEEVEPLEEVEAVEEIEPLEEVEAVEEIEPLEEVEAVEEIEPLEEVEAVEEIEPLEEVEAVEEIEALEEAEPLEEIKETNIIDNALNDALEPAKPRHKGLFWLANKLLMKPASLVSKGLLYLASKKASAKTDSSGRGLLAHASELEKSAPVQGKGLLAHASELEKSAPVQGKGLLAHASELEKPVHVHHGKGLLAYASEIEIKTEEEEEEVEKITIDIDVVSPFSSMFSSLSKEEEENNL